MAELNPDRPCRETWTSFCIPVFRSRDLRYAFVHAPITGLRTGSCLSASSFLGIWIAIEWTFVGSHQKKGSRIGPVKVLPPPAAVHEATEASRAFRPHG